MSEGPAKRRWFRWAMQMGVSVLVVASLGWAYWERTREGPNGLVLVAVVPGVALDVVERELKAQGIESGAEGSLIFCTYVHRYDVDRARGFLLRIQRERPRDVLAVLDKDAGDWHRSPNFPGDWPLPPPKW